MRDANWIRIVLCGFVAGVVWNLLSAVALSVFSPGFVASVQRGALYPPLGGEVFFAVDVVMGVWAMWLYSAIAPRYGARLTTVAIAGVAWWIMKTLQSVKWAALGFVALSPNLMLLAVTSLLATLAASGAWLYDKANGLGRIEEARRGES